MPPIHARAATPNDVDALSPVLARAFRYEEFVSWIFPDESIRLGQAEKFFRTTLVKIAFRNNFEVLTTDDQAGCAIWVEPGHWRIGVRMALPAAVPASRALGRVGLARLLRTGAALEGLHPHEPHWYLSTLGTDPPRQGEGVASALLAPRLRQCDEDGVGAYLETMSPGNVAYYRGKGFEVTHELDLPRGGPHCWTMYREPRPPEPEAEAADSDG